MKKLPCQPLLGPNGLVYDPETKTDLFASELKKKEPDQNNQPLITMLVKPQTS